MIVNKLLILQLIRLSQLLKNIYLTTEGCNSLFFCLLSIWGWFEKGVMPEFEGQLKFKKKSQFLWQIKWTKLDEKI